MTTQICGGTIGLVVGLLISGCWLLPYLRSRFEDVRPWWRH